MKYEKDGKWVWRLQQESSLEKGRTISFASERVERHNWNLNLKILRRQIHAQVDQRLREQHELNDRCEDTCGQDEQ